MAAAAEGDASACNLEAWLHEVAAPGEEGYHVLCVVAPERFRIYVGGVATEEPQVLELDGQGFRRPLARLLGIRKKIRYDVSGKALQWLKQPWVLYTEEGEELQPGSEGPALTSGRVLLLFEGGVWRWPTMKLGYERRVLPNVLLRTVARQPALFEVILTQPEPALTGSEHLSKSLLTDVVTIAEPLLVPSQTEGKVDKNMRSSEQTFLPYESNPKLSKLRRLTSALLRAPTENLVEFQVLRYQKGQHYDAHRDYWDPREFPDVPRFKNREGFWTMRHATLLWYLEAPEAGGETWFPRAHGGGIPSDNWMACDDRGVKISPANATAVLFYNLRADGEIDEYSWHCGCPVRAGTKWAANSWLSNTPELPRLWLKDARERAKRKWDSVDTPLEL